MERRHRRNPAGKRILIFAIVFAVLLAGAGFYVYNEFKITTVNITGSDKYTYDELYEYIFEDRDDRNVLLFKFTDSRNPMPEIPFIAKVDIDVTGTHTLDITVYEKTIVGYVTYKGTNMYFDKDGVIVECSTQVLPEVPRVQGLKFDSIVMYEKLNVPDGEVFKTLLDITQYLDKYSIDVDGIYVGENSSIDIILGDVTVKLGKNDYNMGVRIYELSCMLEELKGLKGVLHMEEYGEGTDYITFTETK
ncbi:MAG: cell division protein FtsQ/DivIB [Butyrivibrio sp.]